MSRKFSTIMLMFVKNDDCVTLGKLQYDIPSPIYLFILSLHFVPSLQSAVCILYLVGILYPVCSLQSAVCSGPFHFLSAPPLLRVFEFYPLRKVNFLPPSERKIKVPTHFPFQNLLKIKGADTVAPSETAFKDPLPPPQIS